MGARNGLITHFPRGCIQQNAGSHRTPSLLPASLADRLQRRQLSFGEDQGLAFLWERHAPIKTQAALYV
jgi:hypothetical protein